jgi:hypothetical protein
MRGEREREKKMGVWEMMDIETSLAFLKKSKMELMPIRLISVGFAELKNCTKTPKPSHATNIYARWRE